MRVKAIRWEEIAWSYGVELDLLHSALLLVAEGAEVARREGIVGHTWARHIVGAHPSADRRLHAEAVVELAVAIDAAQPLCADGRLARTVE